MKGTEYQAKESDFILRGKVGPLDIWVQKMTQWNQCFSKTGLSQPGARLQILIPVRLAVLSFEVMHLFENSMRTTGSLPKNRHTQSCAKSTDPLKLFYRDPRILVRNTWVKFFFLQQTRIKGLGEDAIVKIERKESFKKHSAQNLIWSMRWKLWRWVACPDFYNSSVVETPTTPNIHFPFSFTVIRGWIYGYWIKIYIPASQAASWPCN